MQISTTNIHHRIKHLEPIYSMANNTVYTATGGLNGELKIWKKENSESFKLYKLFKKHSGAVVTLQYTPDGKYLISGGDDGKVNIYFDKAHILTINHSSDIIQVKTIQIEDDYYIYSLTLNNIIFVYKFTEKKYIEQTKFIVDKEVYSILVTTNNNLYIQTSNQLIFYENFLLKKTIDLSEGPIVEHMANKMVQIGNYIAVGMQFNNNYNSVDIYTASLDKMYSFIGHVAPVELIATKQIVFEDKIIDLVILFCQDTSVSCWTSISCKPFLLIKNFSNGPALDYYWNDNSLYVSTYDGVVKKIEFNSTELSFNTQNLKNTELNFSLINKKLKTEKSLIKNYIAFKRCNGYQKNNSIVIDKSKNMQLITTTNNVIKIKNTNNIIEIKYNNHSSKSDAKKTDNEIKRIQLFSKDDNNHFPGLHEDILIKSSHNNISITFESPILNLPITKPFETILTLNTTEIKLKYDKSQIIVTRNNQLIFNYFTHSASHISYSDKYIVIYETKYIKIYSLSTGCLLYPFICKEICYITINEDKFLWVTVKGIIEIYELMSGKFLHIHTSELPKLSQFESIKIFENELKLSNTINLNKKYKISNTKQSSSLILLAQYEQNEFMILLNNLWIVLENNNSNLLFNINELENMILGNFYSWNISKSQLFKNNLVDLAYLFFNKIDVINLEIEYKIRKILEILDNPTRYEMLKILSKKKFTEKIIEDEYKKYFKKKLV